MNTTQDQNVEIQIALVDLAFQAITLGINAMAVVFTNLLTQVYEQFFGFFQGFFM